LGTWTGAISPAEMVIARGSVFIAANTKLYRIDPKQPPGTVQTVSSDVGFFPSGITCDGFFIWVSLAHNLQRVNPTNGVVTTFSAPNAGAGKLLFARNHLWLTDPVSNNLFEVNLDGTIEQTITVGDRPGAPAFDGTNIWVPNLNDNTLSVVRASTGTVLATLRGNGLNAPAAAAYDGERIVVVSFLGDSASLWNATQLIALGSFDAPAGSGPAGVCSDGINFWIALRDANKLARF
jgi:DNA-binding beta-propeller fold protein YncE